MEPVTLQQLLEAGCHFGHKSERWNPRAADFIYTEKDGIHIIDLAKTKAGLEAAVDYIRTTVAGGGEIIFVGTKRQAQGILKQEAVNIGAPYFVERWIGGFLTNWEEIKKNIDKVNRMAKEQEEGGWKKFPKHEQMKMARHLDRLRVYYGGVTHVAKIPSALFIIDVKKEQSAIREAERVGIPVIGIVDTNSDPSEIAFAIPANDDAVGSITLLISAVARAYEQGKKDFESSMKAGAAVQAEESKKKAAQAGKPVEPDKKSTEKKQGDSKTDKPVETVKKRAAAVKKPAKTNVEPETKVVEEPQTKTAKTVKTKQKKA